MRPCRIKTGEQVAASPAALTLIGMISEAPEVATVGEKEVTRVAPSVAMGTVGKAAEAPKAPLVPVLGMVTTTPVKSFQMDDTLLFGGFGVGKGGWLGPDRDIGNGNIDDVGGSSRGGGGLGNGSSQSDGGDLYHNDQGSGYGSGMFFEEGLDG